MSGREIASTPNGFAGPTDETRSKARERALYLGALAVVMLIGASVRVMAIGHSDFPINDGGMFYQAIAQIQAAHFRLPADLHYNGLTIPFAYPPLAFYIAGLISSATGASLIQLLRILPLVFSLATIGAFMTFADEMLCDRATVVVASLAFALVPRSHNWEIMGGGLTRGLAFFFAILALWQTYRAFTRRSRTSLILASLFGALTCVSHIEMAWFLIFSSAVFLMAFGRSRRGLIDAALLSAGVLLLSAPWWLIVVARHGVSPFLNAGHSGADATINIIGLLLLLNWGDEPWFPLFGSLAALAIIVSLRRGHNFLPVWVLVALVLDTRKFETDAMVPLSLLVGAAIVQFLVPFMAVTADRIANEAGEPWIARPATSRVIRWLSPAVVALMLGYGWISSVTASSGSFNSLSPAERDAMSWVQYSTPETARFAVVTGDIWARDRSSEWFDVLARRVSVATVQGYEWTPHNGFSRQMLVYKALQACSTETSACIADWNRAAGVSFDYVYLARRDIQEGYVDYHAPCCDGLVDSLKHDPSYVLVYQNDDATIFKRLSTSDAPSRRAITQAARQTRRQP